MASTNHSYSRQPPALTSAYGGPGFQQRDSVNPLCSPAPPFTTGKLRHGEVCFLIKTLQVRSRRVGFGSRRFPPGTSHAAAGTDSCRRWGCWLAPQPCASLSSQGWGHPKLDPRGPLLPAPAASVDLIHREFVRRSQTGRCSRGRCLGAPSSPPSPWKPSPPCPPAGLPLLPLLPPPKLPHLLPPRRFVAKARKETFFTLCLLSLPALLRPRQRFIPSLRLVVLERAGLRDALMGP